MLKNTFTFISLFLGVTLFAGGGGGSSFGGDSTKDKYGTKKLYITTSSSSSSAKCTDYIDIQTKVSVRLQNWFYLTKLWKGGYATTTITQCGKAMNADKLTITQNTITLMPNMGYVHIPHKTNSVYNQSYIKHELELLDDTGTVSTEHYVLKDGKSTTLHVENDWNTDTVYHMLYGK